MIHGSQNNSHPVTLIAKKLACPLPPNSMLLHRFAWKNLQKNSHFGSDAGMHWATTLIKGARGIRCDMTTCRRMAVFFWRTRYSHSILPRCSMYGIFTYIWVMFGVHVDTYSRTTEHLGGNQDIITITPKNTVYTLQLQTPRLRLYLKGFNLGVCLHLLRGYLEH